MPPTVTMPLELLVLWAAFDNVLGALKRMVRTKAEKRKIEELRLMWEVHLKSAGEIDVTMRGDMLRQARNILGSKHAAKEWLWKPLKELRGLAPIAAEPVEATKVLLRLEQGVFG